MNTAASLASMPLSAGPEADNRAFTLNVGVRVSFAAQRVLPVVSVLLLTLQYGRLEVQNNPWSYDIPHQMGL